MGVTGGMTESLEGYGEAWIGGQEILLLPLTYGATAGGPWSPQWYWDGGDYIRLSLRFLRWREGALGPRPNLSKVWRLTR